MALCEGPIAGINQIWTRAIGLHACAASGCRCSPGRRRRACGAISRRPIPSQALAYQGTAYVCAPNYNLSDSATLDNHNFEVKGFCYGTRLWSGYARSTPIRRLVVSRLPDQCAIRRRLSGRQHRCDDAVRLRRQMRRYQTYCRAVGLALSPALTDQEQASSILGALAATDQHRGGVVGRPACGSFPMATARVTGNGVTFTSERDADLQSRPTTTSRSRTTRIRCRSRGPIRTRPTTSGGSKSPSEAMPTI